LIWGFSKAENIPGALTFAVAKTMGKGIEGKSRRRINAPEDMGYKDKTT